MVLSEERMSAATTESIEFAFQSDSGRVRNGNEDACGHDLAQGIFVVCDGMGGAAAGEVASRMAVQTILEQWRKSAPETQAATSVPEAENPDPGNPDPLDIRGRLKAAIREASGRIFRRATKDLKLQGMGTTAVVLYVERNDAGTTAWLAHAGDSRCYRWRAGKLQQMTTDHSLVDEQVRLGHMTSAQAVSSPFRNVITRAVGATETVEPDVLRDAAESGDMYLLCSDGLTRELEDAQIEAILSAQVQSKTPMEDACTELVRAANEHGGRDNITCILVRIG
jgi:protein phosphatase